MSKPKRLLSIITYQTLDTMFDAPKKNTIKIGTYAILYFFIIIVPRLVITAPPNAAKHVNNIASSKGINLFFRSVIRLVIPIQK